MPDPKPAKPARVVLSRAQKALLLVLLLGVSLVLLDSSFRAYLALSGREATPAAVRKSIDQLVTAMGQLLPTPGDEKGEGGAPAARDTVLLQPYTGYDGAGNVRQIAWEMDYYRSADAARTYDVMVLGGSVAGIFASLRGERFLDALRADPRFREQKLRLTSFALGGFKQPQQTTLLAVLLAAGLKPDAVVNIDGFNEAALAFDNAEHEVFPLYPSRTHWANVAKGASLSPEAQRQLYFILRSREQVESLSATCARFGLDKSAVLGTLVLDRLNALRRFYSGSYQRYVQALSAPDARVGADPVAGPQFLAAGDRPRTLKTIVGNWMEGSLSLHALCTARSIHYLHVLQPTLHDTGAKPVTPEEEEKGLGALEWMEGARLCYPLFRAAGPWLRSKGVLFHDASRLFAGMSESIYYDVCHFEGSGLDLFADDVARVFLESLGS